MELPLHITFHGLSVSKPITEKVRARAQRLHKFFDPIQSCRVAIEVPHRHHATGNQYRVRIAVRVPGRELVVSGGPHGDQGHSDIAVALRTSFDAMRRQLEDYAALLRENVKARAASTGTAS